MNLGKMIERSIVVDALPPSGEGEAASDDDPGPSPAGVVILDDAWLDHETAVTVVHEAVNAAALFVPALAEGDIVIALSSDEAVRELNARFRGHDKPTNVLSFRAASSPPREAETPSGDIAIAYGTVVREATDEGKPFHHHLAHLVVHGLLHLAGHDHHNDADAEQMEALERRILAILNIPDPYRSDFDEERPLAG
jgi:probable rRNA maturation factor